MLKIFKKLHADFWHSNSAVPAYFSELAGTALMMFNGIAWICWIFGTGSPISGWLPNPTFRLLVVGICFASGVTAVAYSPLAQRSGGHLNPAVTLGFWMLHKISARAALIYALMQAIGAFIGTALVLVLWPDLASSVKLGATLLGQGVNPAMGFILEVGSTFVLMLTILIAANSPWKRWTGVAVGVAIALLVLVEAPFTGTSLNPARSLAPAALISIWQDQWIYWIAPCVGAALAVVLYQYRAIATDTSYFSKLFHPKSAALHRPCGYCHQNQAERFSTRR